MFCFTLVNCLYIILSFIFNCFWGIKIFCHLPCHFDLSLFLKKAVMLSKYCSYNFRFYFIFSFAYRWVNLVNINWNNLLASNARTSVFERLDTNELFCHVCYVIRRCSEFKNPCSRIAGRQIVTKYVYPSIDLFFFCISVHQVKRWVHMLVVR